MELSDLLTFSTVARLGGITRAADELNTVQSNVTQRVKALEAEIGTALFERHSRGMTLTGAGRRLLPYAQRMAALSREALGSWDDLPRSLRRAGGVGCLSCHGPGAIPEESSRWAILRAASSGSSSNPASIWV